MSKPRKKWFHSEGERPYTITVYERVSGGILYGRIWDSTKRNGRGDWIRVSLKHRDQERAKLWALEQAAKYRRGASDIQEGKVTVSQVLSLYERYRTPRKSRKEQKADLRRIEMWNRVLGPGKNPNQVSLGDWERFIDRRSSGEIDGRGRLIPLENRSPVKTRSVEADLKWLRLVFNWAAKWQTPLGHYLLRENPVRGFEIPTEKNPRREVATQDRFEAIRAVSDQVPMEVRWNGRGESRRSYLSELLEIVNGTARRISAVCQLRYENLLLERDEEQFPYGRILWPAETDKQGKQRIVAMNLRVRQAINRILAERPGLGPNFLFPKPSDQNEPIDVHLASKWLSKAEKLAGVGKQDGTLWHAYRRKWATERKHLPDVDVAEAGGWASIEALKTAYQRADSETILKAVLEPRELREVG